MLSHDTRMRCSMVDLYYVLYGKKRPTCLPIPELAALLKPQRVDSFIESELSVMKPSQSQPEAMDVSMSLKRKAASPLKELEVVTADDLGVATVEVIGADDTNKSSRSKDVGEAGPSKVKTEYYSENSASLPGISGTGGPVGFEPGMFNKEDKLKKKKKDRKKHKHKHKHKHDHKHTKEKEKDKEKKDLGKLKIKEETLSSASSSPSPPASSASKEFTF
uniref:Transcription initiation factor TFIID subunit 2 TPR repeats domain-containing protein n=5 Tax=Homalodisca TaxID=139475 RepID=A0A1B6I826_9HEMI